MALRAKKYFKDFKAETYTDEKGRTKRRFIYVGDRYIRRVSESRHLAERILYVVFSMIAAVLLVFAMLRKSEMNYAGVFAGISILAIVPAFCVAEASWEAVFRKKELTKNDYQERFIMLKAMAIAAVVLNLTLAIGFLVYLCKAEDAAAKSENLGGFLMTLANVLLYGAIAAEEFLVKYDMIPGEHIVETNIDGTVQQDAPKKYYD